ncbi:MAG TPA: efflux RND transporter periplasmic adaptor subunit [Cytophagaceae bacterium]
MKYLFPIALLLLILFNTSCNINADQAVTTEQNVFPVIKLTTVSAPITNEFVANIQAVKNVEINARVKGYLEQVYVDEGQYVKKDQLLFRINDEEYRSALTKAKANLAYAIAEANELELETERMRALVDNQVVSKTELKVALARLDAAKAKIIEAQSTVDHATMQVNLTRIKAPFDGIIDRIPFKIGSLIDEGTTLTNLSDISEVYAYFNVSETEYLQYVKSHKGKKEEEVELILADGSKFGQPGKVETMEGEFNQTTGSIAFRARFPNPDKLLKHGSTGTIQLTGLHKASILIPHKACIELQDKNFVFVVDKDNKVSMKSFKPKYRLSESYIVESGLNAGDVVVYEGVQSIREGMIITPRYMDKVYSDLLLSEQQ